MLDEQTAGLGHNQPPAYSVEVLDDFKTAAEDFLKVTKQWLDMEKIETDAHAEQVTDQINGLRGLFKKVDDSRKEQKKPHADAATEVDDAYRSTLTKLKTAGEKLKPKLAAYASAKDEKERAEQAAAEEAARKQAEEAEASRIEAEKSNDIGAQVEAEEQAKAAEDAKKAAAKKPKTQVKSASGAGRTMSLRKTKEVEITNINVLFMALREDPEVKEVLSRIATRTVRAAGYDEGDPLPGIKVNIKETMA